MIFRIVRFLKWLIRQLCPYCIVAYWEKRDGHWTHVVIVSEGREKIIYVDGLQLVTIQEW